MTGRRRSRRRSAGPATRPWTARPRRSRGGRRSSTSRSSARSPRSCCPGLACGGCGTVTRAAPPPGFHPGSVAYGPVLNAAAVLLSCYGNVPAERSAQLIGMLTGAGRLSRLGGQGRRPDERGGCGPAGFDEAMAAALAARGRPRRRRDPGERAGQGPPPGPGAGRRRRGGPGGEGREEGRRGGAARAGRHHPGRAAAAPAGPGLPPQGRVGGGHPRRASPGTS